MLKDFKNYLIFLINCKILFSIKKKDIVIYDCINSYELSKLFENENFFILSSRREQIKNLYLSKKIILFILKNFFKRKIKLNYMIALIEEINPKLVITGIDNSVEFSKLARFYYKKKIFVAVQAANRGDIFGNYSNLNKNFFLPFYFCFSEFDIKLFKKRKIKVNKYLITGSLKNSFYKYKYKNVRKKNYDICFVSKAFWQPHSGEKTFLYYNIIKSLKFLAKYAKDKNKKILIQSKVKKNKPEIRLYKNIFRGIKFTIGWNKQTSGSSYKAIMKSSLVIGAPSTLLREAYFFNKKVLCCDSLGTINPSVHPFHGINYLRNFNYELFEKRIDKLFSLNYKSYLKKLDNPKNFYMSSVNTIHFVQKFVNKILNTQTKN
jgi:surface carbohydrate biosynthesis protein